MSVLNEILEKACIDLAARQRQTPLERLKEIAKKAAWPRDALAALSGQDVAVL